MKSQQMVLQTAHLGRRDMGRPVPSTGCDQLAVASLKHAQPWWATGGYCACHRNLCKPKPRPYLPITSGGTGKHDTAELGRGGEAVTSRNHDKPSDGSRVLFGELWEGRRRCEDAPLEFTSDQFKSKQIRSTTFPHATSLKWPCDIFVQDQNKARQSDMSKSHQAPVFILASVNALQH